MDEGTGRTVRSHEVTVNASPGSYALNTGNSTYGSLFSGWSGACTGSGATCQVTMDATKNVTATFTSVQSNNGGKLYLPLIRK